MADRLDPPLWTVLRRHVGEPLPDDVRAAARDALSWRDPDAALAGLVLDSAREPVGHIRADGHPRGDGEPRLLSFASAEVTIDVEATYRDGTVSLLGQLAPAGAGAVEVDHRLGVATARPDRLGRFRVDGVEFGPVRLRVSGTTGPVHTEWVVF
jgi:hypothetical protein